MWRYRGGGALAVLAAAAVGVRDAQVGCGVVAVIPSAASDVDDGGDGRPVPGGAATVDDY
jgi:hypothetical protein